MLSSLHSCAPTNIVRAEEGHVHTTSSELHSQNHHIQQNHTQIASTIKLSAKILSHPGQSYPRIKGNWTWLKIPLTL